MPASVVQTASVATNAAGTTTATFAGTPVAGNIIVAHVVADSQVTGPAGYTLRGAVHNDFSAYIWDKTAGAAEPKTVTITYTGTVPAVLTVIELGGVSGFDVISAARSIANSPRTTNGVTSVASNANPTGSFVLAISCQHNFATKPTTPVWNNTFTNLTLTGSGGGTGSAAAFDSNVFVATRTVTTSTTIGLTTLSWTNSVQDVNAWHIAYTAGAVTAPPPPPTPSTFLLEVDFPQTGTWSDITTYVESLTIRRGRQRETDQVTTGTLSASLMNDTKRFTPGNTAGAYYPNVKPERPIRFSVNTGTLTYLFTGTTDKFDMAWEGGRLATASVEATDGFDGLARRTAQSLYTEQLFTITPTAFYPLSEPADSVLFTNAQPATPWPLAQLLNSKYGAGTFTAGDLAGFMAGGAPANTCCTFAHTGTGNTEGMTVIQFAGGQVADGVVPPGTGPWAWACWFKTSTVGADSQALLFARGAPYSDPSLGVTHSLAMLALNGAGNVTADIGTPSGASVHAQSVGTYNNGQWHRATMSVAADNKTVTLNVDNAATVTVVGGSAVTLPDLQWCVAGGTLSPWAESTFALTGSIASVEFYSAVISALDHQILYNFGLSGYYVTNDTGAMITDLAQDFGFSQVAYPFIIADTGITAHTAIYDITGQTYLAAMQTYEATEQGLLYMRGDGNLTFKNRAYRVDQPSAFILDCNNGDIELDATFGIDKTLLFNDYSATRPGGGPQRVRDVASTNEFGIFTNAPTPSGAQSVLLTTDNEVNDYAAYKVAQYSQPKPRITGITLDLLTNPGLWQVVQFIDIGTRFTVVNLPPEAPATTMDFVAEGMTWSFVPGLEAKLHLDTSPPDTTPYFTLDDTMYGLLDNNALFF